MKRNTQRGSGLIESLISIMVVSIGFLGFAGLQLNGLAAANDSLFRSKAVYLTNQMTDRVRANLPAANAGAYNNFSTQTVPSPGCSISVNCTAAQLATTVGTVTRLAHAGNLRALNGSIGKPNLFRIVTPWAASRCRGRA